MCECAKGLFIRTFAHFHIRTLLLCSASNSVLLVLRCTCPAPGGLRALLALAKAVSKAHGNLPVVPTVLYPGINNIILGLALVALDPERVAEVQAHGALSFHYLLLPAKAEHVHRFVDAELLNTPCPVKT